MKKILFVSLRGIGDTVLALPLLRALRHHYVRAEFTLVMPAPSLQIFEAEPWAARQFPYDRRKMSSLDAQWAFFSKLREEKFDLAVCPHASFRTGLIALLSGAGLRSVRNHSGRDWFNNVPCAIPKEPKNIILRLFDGVDALGIEPLDTRPRMILTGKALKKATEIWKLLKLKGRRALLLAPGGSVAERRWPWERFMELGLKSRKLGWEPFVLQAPGDSIGALPTGLRKIEVTGVQELGAVARKAGWLLGNNSGPRHVAAACGARTFTLFGGDLLKEWHPYAAKDGHLALRADSGKMTDLVLESVYREVLRWRNLSPPHA